ncbi:MAG: glycerol-3-phosphate dehydrogenase/oxidase [Acidobacteria bacterium]|uniref:Glycerol-3-phosphate dehydrogenase/oxidase n=1 Tax=Candidatus Polarisedimenticola svalbardensis TaxID=2886004 RepID=A0A8J6Y266_9BACT|nr:glycerol-3-phosphate dehydrogenase/oxidase [Candidatus Polarisedimenticola svalbardensis]
MTMIDVLVIGGGIHGTGVAQAAAAAGYSALLVERETLGHGTSSKSSKLIHGGLRYLESGHFGLVRESLRERRILLRIAPELVKPVRFYIPVYDDTSRPAWQIRAGLGFYAVLGGLGKENRFRSVPRSQWGGLDGLQLRGLRKVFQYWDAATDDLQLTQAIGRSAANLGAAIREHTEFLSATAVRGGFKVRFRTIEGEGEEECRTLVNAAGPWVNRVLEKVDPAQPRIGIDLVQGTHLVLQDGPSMGVYYTEALSDRRGIFLMPWKGHGLLGTTEKVFTGHPDGTKPSRDEVDYLLENVAHYFPNLDATVIESWSGLRVLLRGQGDLFRRPREMVLLPGAGKPPRLVTLYGGKLTGYRASALKALKQLSPVLPTVPPRADTAELPLE